MAQRDGSAPQGVLLVFRYRDHQREMRLAFSERVPPVAAWVKLCSKAWAGALGSSMALRVAPSSAEADDGFALANDADAARAWSIVREHGVVTLHVHLSDEERARLQSMHRQREASSAPSTPPSTDDKLPSASTASEPAAAKPGERPRVSPALAAVAHPVTGSNSTATPALEQSIADSSAPRPRDTPPDPAESIISVSSSSSVSVASAGVVEHGAAAAPATRLHAAPAAAESAPTSGSVVSSMSTGTTSTITAPASTKYRQGRLLRHEDGCDVFLSMHADTGRMVAMCQVPISSESKSLDAKLLQQRLVMASGLIRRLNTVPCAVLIRFFDAHVDDRMTVLRVFREHMPGGSVEDQITRFGALSETLASRYAFAALTGLASLHDLGLRHGGLDGTSILIDARGAPRLTAVALGRAVHILLTHEAPLEALSRTSTPCGDVAALAMLVLRMITGIAPDDSRLAGLVQAVRQSANQAPPVLADRVSQQPNGSRTGRGNLSANLANPGLRVDTSGGTVRGVSTPIRTGSVVGGASTADSSDAVTPITDLSTASSDVLGLLPGGGVASSAGGGGAPLSRVILGIETRVRRRSMPDAVGDAGPSQLAEVAPPVPLIGAQDGDVSSQLSLMSAAVDSAGRTDGSLSGLSSSSSSSSSNTSSSSFVLPPGSALAATMTSEASSCEALRARCMELVPATASEQLKDFLALCLIPRDGARPTVRDLLKHPFVEPHKNLDAGEAMQPTALLGGGLSSQPAGLTSGLSQGPAPTSVPRPNGELPFAPLPLVVNGRTYRVGRSSTLAYRPTLAGKSPPLTAAHPGSASGDADSESTKRQQVVAAWWAVLARPPRSETEENDSPRVDGAAAAADASRSQALDPERKSVIEALGYDPDAIDADLDAERTELEGCNEATVADSDDDSENDDELFRSADGPTVAPTIVIKANSGPIRPITSGTPGVSLASLRPPGLSLGSLATGAAPAFSGQSIVYSSDAHAAHSLSHPAGPPTLSVRVDAAAPPPSQGVASFATRLAGMGRAGGAVQGAGLSGALGIGLQLQVGALGPPSSLGGIAPLREASHAVAQPEPVSNPWGDEVRVSRYHRQSSSEAAVSALSLTLNDRSTGRPALSSMPSLGSGYFARDAAAAATDGHSAQLGNVPTSGGTRRDLATSEAWTDLSDSIDLTVSGGWGLFDPHEAVNRAVDDKMFAENRAGMRDEDEDAQGRGRATRLFLARAAIPRAGPVAPAVSDDAHDVEAPELSLSDPVIRERGGQSQRQAGHSHQSSGFLEPSSGRGTEGDSRFARPPPLPTATSALSTWEHLVAALPQESKDVPPGHPQLAMGLADEIPARPPGPPPPQVLAASRRGGSTTTHRSRSSRHHSHRAESSRWLRPQGHFNYFLVPDPEAEAYDPRSPANMKTCDALCGGGVSGCPGCLPKDSAEYTAAVEVRNSLKQIVFDFWLARARYSLYRWDVYGYDYYGRGFGFPNEVGAGVQTDRQMLAKTFASIPAEPPTVPRPLNAPFVSKSKLPPGTIIQQHQELQTASSFASRSEAPAPTSRPRNTTLPPQPPPTPPTLLQVMAGNARKAVQSATEQLDAIESGVAIGRSRRQGLAHAASDDVNIAPVIVPGPATSPPVRQPPLSARAVSLVATAFLEGMQSHSAVVAPSVAATLTSSLAHSSSWIHVESAGPSPASSPRDSHEALAKHASSGLASSRVHTGAADMMLDDSRQTLRQEATQQPDVPTEVIVADSAVVTAESSEVHAPLHETLYDEDAAPAGLQWLDSARSGLGSARSDPSSARSSYGAFGPLSARYVVDTPREGRGSALARVIEDYEAGDRTELSASQDSIVLVDRQDETGWWECRLIQGSQDGRQIGAPEIIDGQCPKGYLPCTFLEWVTKDALLPLVADALGLTSPAAVDQSAHMAKPGARAPASKHSQRLADRSQTGAGHVASRTPQAGRLGKADQVTGLSAVQEEEGDDSEGAASDTEPDPEALASDHTDQPIEDPPVRPDEPEAGAPRLLKRLSSGAEVGSPPAGLWRLNPASNLWEKADPMTGQVTVSADPFAHQWAIVEDGSESDEDDEEDEDEEDEKPSDTESRSLASASARVFIAKQDHDPDGEGEMGMAMGDRILIRVMDDSGWWEGVNLRTRDDGWVPAAYLDDASGWSEQLDSATEESMEDRV